MSSVAACPFSLENAVLGAGFCAFEWEIEISRPRGVLAVGAADALVLERDTSSVLHVFDSDGDGIPDAKRSVATASGLNHGLALNGDYIYASSDTTVYRWPYEATNFTTGDVEVVVVNINADGAGGAPQGHRTRTLVFDDIGRLYISVGSYANVDEDSYRSRIRRFDLKDGLSQDFSNGEVFADGLRNEVGMAFDKHGVLWGVENGADNLFRSDLGGDIKNDNPVRVSASKIIWCRSIHHKQVVLTIYVPMFRQKNSIDSKKRMQESTGDVSIYNRLCLGFQEV